MINPRKRPHFSSGSIPQTSNLEFKDEKFEVIPVPGKIAPPGDQNISDAMGPGAGSPGAGTPGTDYSEDELMFISESIWNLPCIFFEKIPPRDPAKIKNFNTQFFRYCKKKGINPYDYFFDEFPLAMSGIGLAVGIWRDYKAGYKNNGKTENEEDKKLSSDYDHAKEIAEQKEKDILAGKISSASEGQGG